MTATTGTRDRTAEDGGDTAVPIATSLDRLAARTLVEARRAQGLTPAQLSARSGLDVALVERAEAGDVGASPAMGALLAAVGLDPAPLVGGEPFGPVPVPPVDREHARAIAYLSGLADTRDGWLLFPDAAAIPVPPEVPQEEAAAAQAAHDAWRHRGRPVATAMMAVIGTGVLGFFADLYVMAGSRYPGHEVGWVPLDSLPAIGMYACGGAIFVGLVLAMACMSAEERAANPHSPALDAIRARGKRRGRRIAQVRSACSRAFEVSPRGVVAHAVGQDGLERREYHAAAFQEVRVTDEDEAHVTVRIASLVGTLDMPWLRRSRDLVRLLDGWSAGADARPSGYLPGPQ